MSRVVDVRQEAGRVVIVLRPYTLWQTIAFPIGQLAALGVLSSVMKPVFAQDRVIFGLIWLGAGLVLGALASLIVSILVGREEVVTISGAQLLIDHQVLRRPELRRRRTYSVDRIANLRAVGPAKPAQPWVVNLAFDYNGSTVRFGLGVGGPDADHVLQALAAAMPAWAYQEPTRPSATAAMTSERRAWSRVTLLVAALAIACVAEVLLAWPLDPTKMTLGLAVALVSGGFIPVWAWVILILESRTVWRSRVWIRLIAILYVGASLVAATYVMTWVRDDLLSPFRSVNRGDLLTLWFVNMFLLIVGLFWAAHRADKRGWQVREQRPVSANISGK